MNFRRYDEIRTKLTLGMIPAAIWFFIWAFTPASEILNDLVSAGVLLLFLIGGFGWSLFSLGKGQD